MGIRLEFGVEEEPSFSVKERKSRFLPEAKAKSAFPFHRPNIYVPRVLCWRRLRVPPNWRTHPIITFVERIILMIFLQVPASCFSQEMRR
eukprot:scaffold39136_cov209-Skeletonema_marinoi.AAC.2